MKTLKKIFFETKMTWKRVILLSLICGVVPGLLMRPAFLDGTSFQQPGISYEFWILFALYIVLNCEKPLEAGIKTFVAFVISQPLIYLVQVPFASMGWGLFRYYLTWIIPTLLTFPGAIVAWYTKKGNLLSALILTVANGILCFTIPYFVQEMETCFPRLLLSCLFMLAEIVCFILLLLPRKKERMIAFALVVCMLAVFFYRQFGVGTTVRYLYSDLEGEAPYELVSEHSLYDVSVSGENIIIEYEQKKVKKSGTDVIRYTDKNGTEYEIPLTYGDGSCRADE